MREKLIELLWKYDQMRMMRMGIEECADHLIANGVTVTDNNGKWISVKERLPEPETEVVILAERKNYSFKKKGVTTHHIVTTGMYEDGSKNTEDSNWVWETDGFEYDEELDAYIIPEGWWEWKHYIDDECHNYAIDDVVTHWMPLPEPPKGE
jgi:hypothetical protein